MYHLLGAKENLKTMLLLASSYAPVDGIKTSENLKFAYINFLKTIQPESSMPSSGRFEFVRNESIVCQLIVFFKEKSRLNDLNQGSVIVKASRLTTHEKMSERISHLEKIFVQLSQKYSEFSQLFKMVINFVFCAYSDRAGGGSTSAAIGIIWANFREVWSLNDYLEFFTHELAHNLMFLDERRFRHYSTYSEIEKPDNFAHSAILNRNRPLDKVLHSLVVATEICLLRDWMIGHPSSPKLHPPTPAILESSFKTIDSLLAVNQRSSLLTDRGVELIHLCSQELHRISSSKVNFNESQ